MNLRDATTEDAEAIAQVHVASFCRAFRGVLPDSAVDGFTVAKRLPRLETFLADENTRTLVAAEAGAIVGFVDFGMSRDEDAAEMCGEVYAIYVDPRFWGKRVAGKLLGAALDGLRRTGCTHVTLWSVKGNLQARGFYLKNGFKVERTVTQKDNEDRERTMERFKLELADE